MSLLPLPKVDRGKGDKVRRMRRRREEWREEEEEEVLEGSRYSLYLCLFAYEVLYARGGKIHSRIETPMFFVVCECG